MSLRRFTRLYLDLDATGSTTEKVDHLRAFFRADDDAQTDDKDKAWALALLTGNRPKRATSTATGTRTLSLFGLLGTTRRQQVETHRHSNHVRLHAVGVVCRLRPTRRQQAEAHRHLNRARGPSHLLWPRPTERQ